MILSSHNQLRLNWVLLDIPLAIPKFFCISHPSIMKPSVPNGKFIRPFQPDPVRRSALDHLHCLLNCCHLTWSQQNVQMVRHYYKSMQLVKSTISATQNLFNSDVCQNRVHEERMLLPRIGRHEIDARLSNTPGNPSHIRTLRG